MSDPRGGRLTSGQEDPLALMLGAGEMVPPGVAFRSQLRSRLLALPPAAATPAGPTAAQLAITVAVLAGLGALTIGTWSASRQSTEGRVTATAPAAAALDAPVEDMDRGQAATAVRSPADTVRAVGPPVAIEDRSAAGPPAPTAPAAVASTLPATAAAAPVAADQPDGVRSAAGEEVRRPPDAGQAREREPRPGAAAPAPALPPSPATPTDQPSAEPAAATPTPGADGLPAGPTPAPTGQGWPTLAPPTPTPDG